MGIDARGCRGCREPLAVSLHPLHFTVLCVVWEGQFCLDQLSHFGKFGHGTHTACADVHGFVCPVDFDAAALYIQDEATTCAVLRVWHVIAIHWLALANFTTTCCHFVFPSCLLDYQQGLWYFQSQIRTQHYANTYDPIHMLTRLCEYNAYWAIWQGWDKIYTQRS